MRLSAGKVPLDGAGTPHGSRPQGSAPDVGWAAAQRSRVERVLPGALVGPGRRPAWQRTRVRRVVSAGLVTTGVWLAMSALLPHPAPVGVPIVVVAQDLMPGHVLTLGDLVVADWPRDLTPDRAIADPASLVGKALGAGMSRGEPVTASRVRGLGLLTGARAGLVAAHVRLADPAMATMAAPGDHVDLISSMGRTVAADVVVLAVDAGSESNGGWSATPGAGPPGGVVVAVASDDALRLATADPSGASDVSFSLVMRASDS